MHDDQIGRAIRTLRHRRGWRQEDLSGASGVSRSVIADLEAGNVARHQLDATRAVLASLGARLRTDVLWRGGEIWRLLDADHALLQENWKGLLHRWGWIVEAEVTFSRYGERGSIDLLAWHPLMRLLLVIEIKTAIVDVQQLLGGLDRKMRNARYLAAERRWRPAAIVPMLIVAESSTARRRVSEYPALFATYSLRGRKVYGWLRGPASGPTGLLCYSQLSRARSGDVRRAGRMRVRKHRAD